MAIRNAHSSHWYQKAIRVAIFLPFLVTLAAFLLFSGNAGEKQSVMIERAPAGILLPCR